MKIIMLSLDKTFLGADYSGDAIERHQEYAQRAGFLDIIVFSKAGFANKKIDERLMIYPTNSRFKINYIFDTLKTAQEIYQKNKFDLIVTQDPFLTGLAGWLIKRKFKIPLLIHFHGDFWQNRYWLKEKWFNRLLLILSKFLVKRADGIRAVSSGIKEKLIRAGIDLNKIRVIPTPVDLDGFNHYNIKAVENFRKIHEDCPIILNVARRDKSKDFKTFWESTINNVYKKYPRIVLWQVGAGFNKKQIEQILGQKIPNNLKISFTGEAAFKGTPKVEKNSLINIYHASDIYVSSSCHESFGKVLVEAMACGLPVVATATTGSREIVRDNENGFLVPIGDVSALAEKILFLLNNPEKAKQMGEKGRVMVKERFNQEKIINQIINFWQELTK